MTMKMIKKTLTLGFGLVMMSTAIWAQSLADAKKAVDAEQFQKATAMLKTLVNTQPTKGENFYNLGKVYLRTDELDSARAAFTKGLTAEPKYALNFVGLGHADLLSNNPTSAKTNFDKALALGAKDYLTQMYIGRAYFEQKTPDFVAALPFLVKADELDSKDKDAETFLALADFYAAQKKNSDAYGQYFRALDINPTLIRATVQIGKMNKEAVAFPEAEAKLKEALVADPNYGPAYRELAELNMQWAAFEPKIAEAKKAESLENYRKYLDLTDKSFDSRLRYAQFLVYASDFKTLGEVAANLTSPDPNNPKSFVVLRMRGYSAYENKDYANSILFLNQLFARKQDAARIITQDYLYLGKAYLASGNDSLALVNVTKAVALDSNNVGVLTDVGMAIFKAKKYALAAQTFQKAIEAKKRNSNILTNYYYLGWSKYVNYGTSYAAKLNPDPKILVEADSAFSKVIRERPTFTSAYTYRARIAKYQDDNVNPKWIAATPYEKLVQLLTVSNPELLNTPAAKKDLVEAYNYLGSFYSLTDKQKAIETFNKALVIDPQNVAVAERLKQLTAPPAAAAVKKPAALKKK